MQVKINKLIVFILSLNSLFIEIKIKNKTVRIIDGVKLAKKA